MEKYKCDNCSRSFHATRFKPLCPRCTAGDGADARPPTLPGTALKQQLERFGGITQGCQCNARIQQMNRWGVDGCRENIETIVGWLEESAKQNTVRGKLLYVPGLREKGRNYIRSLVEEAIRQSESDTPSSTADPQ